MLDAQACADETEEAGPRQGVPRGGWGWIFGLRLEKDTQTGGLGGFGFRGPTAVCPTSFMRPCIKIVDDQTWSPATLQMKPCSHKHKLVCIFRAEAQFRQNMRIIACSQGVAGGPAAAADPAPTTHEHMYVNVCEYAPACLRKHAEGRMRQ